MMDLVLVKRDANIYIYGVRGVWVQLLGVHGACIQVILVLHDCIWNSPIASLILPAFNDTGSLGFPHWVTASHFLVGNRKGELKPTTFSLLLLFHIFLSFLEQSVVGRWRVGGGLQMPSGP